MEEGYMEKIRGPNLLLSFMSSFSACISDPVCLLFSFHFHYMADLKIADPCKSFLQCPRNVLRVWSELLNLRLNSLKNLSRCSIFIFSSSKAVPYAIRSREKNNICSVCHICHTNLGINLKISYFLKNKPFPGSHYGFLSFIYYHVIHKWILNELCQMALVSLIAVTIILWPW